jgi:hypothetical protein
MDAVRKKANYLFRGGEFYGSIISDPVIAGDYFAFA